MISAKELLNQFPKPVEPPLEEQVQSLLKYLEEFVIDAAKHQKDRITPFFPYSADNPVTLGVLSKLEELGYTVKHTHNEGYSCGINIRW